MHHFEKQIQIWSHFFGESGYKTERLHIMSHEVYHEGLLEAALEATSFLWICDNNCVDKFLL